MIIRRCKTRSEEILFAKMYMFFEVCQIRYSSRSKIGDTDIQTHLQRLFQVSAF